MRNRLVIAGGPDGTSCCYQGALRPSRAGWGELLRGVEVVDVAGVGVHFQVGGFGVGEEGGDGAGVAGDAGDAGPVGGEDHSAGEAAPVVLGVVLAEAGRGGAGEIDTGP